MDQNVVKEIQNRISSGKNFLVVTRKNPGLDAIAASLALSQSLSQAGKTTSIACPTPLTVEFSNLFGIDKVETKIGNKNLVISLDYVEGSIEKVSYNVEGDKFNLVIQPKSGFPPFSSEKVHYTYSGVAADAIFVIDTEKLEDLDGIYSENKETFETIPLINIDYHQGNMQFGKSNFVDTNASSCSQLVIQLLNPLNIPFDSDTASNLLTGIESATDGFRSPNTTAQDFEAAAFCLRLGAKRLYKQSLERTKKAEEPTKEIFQNQQNQTKSQAKQKPPPDWLQPKIYKGGQLL